MTTLYGIVHVIIRYVISSSKMNITDKHKKFDVALKYLIYL